MSIVDDDDDDDNRVEFLSCLGDILDFFSIFRCRWRGKLIFFLIKIEFPPTFRLSSAHLTAKRGEFDDVPSLLFFFVSGLGDIQVWRMFFRGRWDEIFCQQCNRAAASRATLKWAIKAEAAEDARNIFSIIQETISSDRDDYRNFIAILSSMRVENQQENHIVHTTQSRRAAARRAENHIQINGRKFYDNSSSLPSFDIDSSQQHFSSLKQHTWFFFLSCFRCSLGKYCDEVKSNEKMEDKKKKK